MAASEQESEKKEAVDADGKPLSEQPSSGAPTVEHVEFGAPREPPEELFEQGPARRIVWDEITRGYLAIAFAVRSSLRRASPVSMRVASETLELRLASVSAVCSAPPSA